MAKKRSCRRTENEDKLHDKAVKMRKMTDEQLVHYVEDRVAKAESEGYNRGKKEADSGLCMSYVLNELSRIHGVGPTLLQRIKMHFESKGIS